MKQVMHKLFWAWESDKEEAWLNTLSATGLQLSDVGFCRYVFEEGTPGEYQYRLEMLDNWPRHPQSVQYIRFVEDTGAEYVGSVNRWVYFRKKAEAGAFDLFSNIESRIRHLNRILALAGVLLAVTLLNLGMQISVWASHWRLPGMVMVGLIGVLALLLGYGVVRIGRQRRRLKKEKLLRE